MRGRLAPAARARNLRGKTRTRERSKVARRLAVLTAVAALGVVAAAPGSHAGGGATPITSCGQTVTTNAFLAQDLVCPGSGVVVGADNVTLDLKGHELTGDQDPGDYGVDDQAGHDGLTVKHGVVRAFDDGIFAWGGANHVTVQDVVASGNATYGIAVNGASVRITGATVAGNGQEGIYLPTGGDVRISSSSAVGNGDSGIHVFGGLGVKVSSTTASGNGLDGIHVESSGTTIASSSASGNTHFGIAVVGELEKVSGNQAYGNGFPAGVSDGTGRGISVFSLSTTPTGRNVARGNDDSSECDPTALC